MHVLHNSKGDYIKRHGAVNPKSDEEKAGCQGTNRQPSACPFVPWRRDFTQPGMLHAL